MNCNDFPLPTVPSPEPPWNRPAKSPLTYSIFTDGTMVLTYDTTYLDSTIIRTVASVVSPYVITFPNGIYIRQIVRIYIPGKNLLPFTSAQFSVLGTFAGFTSLLMGDLATSNAAMCEWDGVAWHFYGNATVVP